MEHVPQLIIDLALLMAVAGITTLICKKFKQPLVLGYVLAGFLISPAIGFVPSVGDAADIETWSEIGVIFLMFGLGLEFSVVKLGSVGKPALITALLEIALMMTFGFVCGYLLGWSFFNCIFLGGMLAMSSTTIIIKTFDELGMKAKKFTDLVFGALIVEDIMGIFFMVVLSTIAVGSAVDGGGVVIQLGQMVLYLIVWFALSLLIIPTFIKKVTKILSDEVLLVVAIALCLGMVVLANAIGFSAALGAFIAGSILAGTVQAHRIEKLFKPIKDLFGAVFFVSVGMLVSPQLIVENWFAILIVTLVTLLGKPIASTIGALASGRSFKTSLQVGLSLSQIGEFSFIIAALGVSLGVTADFLYPIIVTVSVVTTLTTPFYIKSTDRAYRVLSKILPDSLVNRIDKRAEIVDNPKEESLWGSYLKSWFFKILMVILAGLGSVQVLNGLFRPLLLMVLPEAFADPILSLITLIVTGIFIANSFQSAHKGDFGKLWTESKQHHIPLVAMLVVGFSVSIAIALYALLAFENLSPWWVLPAIIITIFLALSKHLHTGFLQLETLLLGNLNQRDLVEKATEQSVEDRIQWTEDHLFVTQVEVTKINKRRGKPIPVAFYVAQTCNLDLISVIRDNEKIYEDELAHLTKAALRNALNDPNDSLTLKMHDILTYVGTEDEIIAFNNNMVKANALAEDDTWSEALRDFLEDDPSCGDLICFSLRIDKASAFRGKTISTIDFKQHYGCLVIAIERSLLPVIKPSRNTRLAQNDLLLLLGKREMAEFFKQTPKELLVTPLTIANPQATQAKS